MYKSIDWEDYLLVSMINMFFFVLPFVYTPPNTMKCWWSSMVAPCPNLGKALLLPLNLRCDQGYIDFSLWVFFVNFENIAIFTNTHSHTYTFSLLYSFKTEKKKETRQIYKKKKLTLNEKLS